MILRLILTSRGLPPLRVYKVVVFINIFLKKGLIDNNIIRLYDILVTHTKFLDKILNLLVLLNLPETEYRIRVILKYLSNVSEVISIKSFSYSESLTDIT